MKAQMTDMTPMIKGGAPKAHAMTSLREPDALIKVDLDERCFLFPTAKGVSAINFLIYRDEKLRLELAFPYNISQTPVEFLELKPTDVPEFTRKMVDAVYRTTSFLFIADRRNIAFATHANGYTWQVGDFTSQRELFVSLNCIWRLCGAFGRASDILATPQAH
jgi:hypothetical protein